MDRPDIQDYMFTILGHDGMGEYRLDAKRYANDLDEYCDELLKQIDMLEVDLKLSQKHYDECKDELNKYKVASTVMRNKLTY